MGQGIKNKTVSKLPVEINLVIGGSVRNVFPSSFILGTFDTNLVHCVYCFG